MWPKVVALALLLIGVALGVVGNWLKPPANMGGRAIVAVFTVLLLVAAGVTYFSTESDDRDDNAQQRASTGGDDGTNPPSAAGVEPTSTTPTDPAPGGDIDVNTEDQESTTPDDQAQPPQTGKPAVPTQPCIVGSWALTTIVDYIPYSDQTVTVSYDSGWETRTYNADNTFTISNDWRERGYDNTLNELTTHSNGSAQGSYRLSGSTATYDPVSSVGNWTLAVNGEVQRQSSVIFSRGEETITCSGDSLGIVSGSDYKASYSRK
jgi:hypothetical protein